MRGYLPLLGLAGIAACGPDYQPQLKEAAARSADAAPSGETATAIFAGGCFWCTEKDFEELPGVISAVSGYTGGNVENPTYEQVSAETTGHYEAVRVTYDPARVSYAQLVDYYFRTVDPTDASGQFCDRGDSYRTAIFFADEEQRRLAEAERAEIEESGVLPGPVVTPVLPASKFYEAEEYHQDYYRKNAIKYRFYRTRCGRDSRLAALWGGEEPRN
ncbi:MAG: peptide-methionine (S)-S-oxide reductase MsrA [Sphingomonadaceae bacterium]